MEKMIPLNCRQIIKSTQLFGRWVPLKWNDRMHSLRTVHTKSFRHGCPALCMCSRQRCTQLLQWSPTRLSSKMQFYCKTSFSIRFCQSAELNWCAHLQQEIMIQLLVCRFTNSKWITWTDIIQRTFLFQLHIKNKDLWRFLNLIKHLWHYKTVETTVNNCFCFMDNSNWVTFEVIRKN